MEGGGGMFEGWKKRKNDDSLSRVMRNPNDWVLFSLGLAAPAGAPRDGTGGIVAMFYRHNKNNGFVAGDEKVRPGRARGAEVWRGNLSEKITRRTARAFSPAGAVSPRGGRHDGDAAPRIILRNKYVRSSNAVQNPRHTYRFKPQILSERSWILSFACFVGIRIFSTTFWLYGARMLPERLTISGTITFPRKCGQFRKR